MVTDLGTLETDLKNPKADRSINALEKDVKNVEKARNQQSKPALETGYQKSEADIQAAAQYVKQYPGLSQLNRNTLLLVKQYVKIIKSTKVSTQVATQLSDNLAHLFDYELQMQTNAAFGGQ